MIEQAEQAAEREGMRPGEWNHLQLAASTALGTNRSWTVICQHGRIRIIALRRDWVVNTRICCDGGALIQGNDGDNSISSFIDSASTMVQQTHQSNR